uniref:Gustatory receptor n=1 Tax=Anopheles melas TaxID=34690 RepID=A0A182UF40_9DIPT
MSSLSQSGKLTDSNLVRVAIDLKNQYIGCILVLGIVTVSLVRQPAFSRLIQVLVSVDRAIPEMVRTAGLSAITNVKVNNIVWLRNVLLMLILGVGVKAMLEVTNCLMYIRDSGSPFSSNCLLLCIIPQTLCVISELQFVAFALLISERLKLLNHWLLQLLPHLVRGSEAAYESVRHLVRIHGQLLKAIGLLNCCFGVQNTILLLYQFVTLVELGYNTCMMSVRYAESEVQQGDSTEDFLETVTVYVLAVVTTYSAFHLYINYTDAYSVGTGEDGGKPGPDSTPTVDRQQQVEANFVSIVIDVYNRYSGLILFWLLHAVALANHRSLTAIVLGVLLLDEQIADRLSVVPNHGQWCRFICLHMTFVFLCIGFAEWYNCIMYMSDFIPASEYCIFECFITMLTSSTVELQYVAFVQLIKNRLQLINDLLVELTAYGTNEEQAHYERFRRDAKPPDRGETVSSRLELLSEISSATAEPHHQSRSGPIERAANANTTAPHEPSIPRGGGRWHKIKRQQHKIITVNQAAPSVVMPPRTQKTPLPDQFPLLVASLLRGADHLQPTAMLWLGQWATPAELLPTFWEVLSTLSWAFISTFRILRICNVCNSAKNELHQQRIEFTASGLFTIDHGLMFNIVGSLATYLLILIQFDIAQNGAKWKTELPTRGMAPLV